MSIKSLFARSYLFNAVRATDEFYRIIRLPRRDPYEVTKLPALATAALRTKTGSMTLRPLQALALAEIYDYGGALVLLPVGEGKTLITYLVTTVLERDGLLLVPAKLKEKTMHDFQELSEHWAATHETRVMSYEFISRNKNCLLELKPKVIIADECHKLKSSRAIVSRRVWKYCRANPDIAFVGLSGTLAKRSLKDWWHLQQWALPPALNVLPYGYPELDQWAEALDIKTPFRRPLGALKHFGAKLTDARAGFGEHLNKTPGIIIGNGQTLATALNIFVKKVTCPAIDAALKVLEDKWELPDGTELTTAIEVWQYGKQLSQGFYYKWIEPGPPAWLRARSAYASFMREILKNSRTFESAVEVEERYPTHTVIQAWRAIRGTFIPKNKAHWISDLVAARAAAAMDQVKGLTWVEHKAVGERLWELTQRSYFGELGKDKKGQIITHAKESCIASVKACSEGYNLQYNFAHNTILSVPSTGNAWEQMLGRTHRQGQRADEVTVEVWLTSPLQTRCWEQAQNDAKYLQETLNQKQKLCYATIVNC